MNPSTYEQETGSKQEAFRISPRLAIWLGVLAMSSAAIQIRFAQAGASSLTIAAYRMGLAALIMVPFAVPLIGNEVKRLNWKQIILLGLSGFLLAVHFASWITSLEHNTVASSVVLVTTTPLWVALFSPIFLRERISWVILLGMVIALAGGALIGISDSCTISSGKLACVNIKEFVQGEAFWGDMLALIGAWTAAGYLMCGRKLRTTLSTYSYTFIIYSLAAVLLFIVAGLTKKAIWGFTPLTYLWLLGLAVIPQLLGHSTFNWALRHLPAGYVSIALLGEPIASTILAYFLLGEAPGIVKITGAVIILLGIGITTFANRD